MGISKISLSGFRNFKKKNFSFSPDTTVIIGPNASGKTNVLEAVYLLATGKSFKAKVESETVNHKSEIARISGVTTERIKLELVLTRGVLNIGTNREERVPRKKLLLNGVPRRLFNFAGQFRVVLFDPWSLDLVTHSPSRRRKFLDSVLAQTDRDYYRSILSYEKGLRRRNKILKRIREEGVARSNLAFWDKLLIKNGDYINSKRGEFISFVNETDPLDGEKFSLKYENSTISEMRLEKYARQEIAAATTLVGPHRDDFIFRVKPASRQGGGTGSRVKGRDLALFGSRGEQRMGVLWLKLAELGYIESVVGEKPTLLLDDIFSELDHQHREVVFGILKNQQTVVTSADPHFVEGLKGVDTIRLKT